MANWTVNNAQQIYNIKNWSQGYFGINDQGEMTVSPRGIDDKATITFPDLINELKAEGLEFPILVRFPDILQHRVQVLRQSFVTAMKENEYTGTYVPVYPIKVNQQRYVVETFSRSAAGLEAGSKPELMVVLAMAKPGDGVILCNGYKDNEYIRLALIGQQMGHNVILIIEKYSELATILAEARKMKVIPKLGVRVRLKSIGKGKWQHTGGDKSKFGLPAAQVLRIINDLKREELTSSLQLLHIHMGSQIANIRDLQKGLQELVYYYAAMDDLGLTVRYIDIGGGLGVDYEGTATRSDCSMNYSIQQYANKVVATIAEICRDKKLPFPDIITETGRALTAHHSVLITNITGMDPFAGNNYIDLTISNKDPMVLQELKYALEHIADTPVLETYHDMLYWVEEANTLFALGLLNLEQLAQVEQLYASMCKQLKQRLNLQQRSHREVLDRINEISADKMFVNMSVFISLPDVWSIGQIFPIMPLSQLDKPLTQRVVLQDLTCDSDGRIDNYVDGQGVHTSLPLPQYDAENPYHLGFFLVGAYQEALGDIHNLFGDVQAAQVKWSDGDYRIEHKHMGDNIISVLKHVQYDKTLLVNNYSQQLEAAKLDKELTEQYRQELEQTLLNYTYLD